MRMYDIIAKKRDGGELSKQEIEFFVNGYVNGEIADYQASALLMAIYFRGMTASETATLTMCMANSGDIIDLSPIPGIKVDKHSTGGVGDKTTLIISPIVAACGVPVAKMSGRGLGHTGGTIDKMESIPGLKTSIDRDKFFEIVKNVGVSVIGQSGNIVPADKKIYALRDVTATVESIPLIASSIMSKKIAAGSDCILIDVKTGTGAFMKTIDESIELAETMVKIGESVGRKVIALITDMDRPLGKAIGNSLEIIEVCDTLKGNGPKDLTDISIDLAGNMLYMAKKGTLDECFSLARQTLESGKAFEKLKEMVSCQGGDAKVLDNPDLLDKAKFKHEALSQKDGYIFSMDTEKCGIASMVLGAGRETKEDDIDFSAGIMLKRVIGDKVKKGDVLATLYSSSKQKCLEGEKVFLDCVKMGTEPPKNHPIVYARITSDGVEQFI